MNFWLVQKYALAWINQTLYLSQPMVEFDDSTYSSCTRADKDCKLNLGSICKWIVDKCGKMTVQSLTAQLNETFATRIPVSKIAEKLKAWGLGDILVTDSFDEYIDNLIVSTDTDIDVDDLLQEEFF